MTIIFISIFFFHISTLQGSLIHLFQLSLPVLAECITGMSHACDVSGSCMSPTLKS